MKDNTKITLTYKQLKDLVNESKMFAHAQYLHESDSVFSFDDIDIGYYEVAMPEKDTLRLIRELKRTPKTVGFVETMVHGQSDEVYTRIFGDAELIREILVKFADVHGQDRLNGIDSSFRVSI